MTERRNANLFEVLIGQIRQDDKTNVVLGKALRVLSETELLEPLSDLLALSQRPRIIGLHPPASPSLSLMGTPLESNSEPARSSEKC